MIRISIIVLAFLSFGVQELSAQQKAQLNHIALYVTDLQRSTAFYRDVIGLDTIPEPFHDGLHTWFSIGPKSHLHLIQAGNKKFEHDKNTHLCFTVQDVPAFAHMLEQRKIAYEDWLGARGKSPPAWTGCTKSTFVTRTATGWRSTMPGNDHAFPISRAVIIRVSTARMT